MPTYEQKLWLTFEAKDDQEAAKLSRRLTDAAERGAIEEANGDVTLGAESEPERNDL